MIYDCFTLFNELDLLVLRLKILDPYVDRFVICEASYTHSGIKKEYYLEENWNLVSDWEHKIIYIKFEDEPNGDPYFMENQQRNKLITGLIDANDTDIIMISDLDEIPNPHKIPKHVELGSVLCLVQIMSFYYSNCHRVKNLFWYGGTRICTLGEIKRREVYKRGFNFDPKTFVPAYNSYYTLTRLRLEDDCKYVLNGGYHLSYMGGIASIKTKLLSTSHTEISYQADYTDRQIQSGFDQNTDPLTCDKLIYSDLRNSLFHNEIINMIPENLITSKKSSSFKFWLVLGLNIMKHFLIISKKKLKYLL